MSLTSMDRYWGDEPEANNTKPDDALQDLLAKIEERKKNREALKQSQKKVSLVNTEVTSNSDSQKNEENKIASREPPPKKLKLSSNTNEVKTPPKEKSLAPSSLDSCNFTIIEGLEHKKSSKVKRVLPSWLAKPSIVSVDLKNLSVSINDIPELDPSLISQLKQNKITHFFPVQCQFIPWMLKFHAKCERNWPRDVCVSAPTGSGKTLAFVLPIIQLLKNREVCRVRALVVLPTKDLSFQVYKVFKSYITDTKLKIIHLGKGTLEKEKNKLVAKDEVHGYCSLVDIIVTTPGRLIEHLKYTEGLCLERLRFLVIDEADHVMESEQNQWLIRLQKRIPPFVRNQEVPYVTRPNINKRPMRTQKLLFSATLSQDPEKLKQMNLLQPYLFTSIVKSEHDNKESEIEKRTEFVGKFATPAELEEFFTICPISIKPLVLYHIVKENKWKQILCFADSVANVHKLATLLKELNSLDDSEVSLNIVEISSKLDVDEHHDILKKFNKHSIDILVTTDALARGIDLQNVNYVILYDAPKYVKNYIHRVGRTGRAGNKGTSLVLVTPDEKEQFNGILNTAGKLNVKEMPVTIDDLRHLETVYKEALQSLQNHMKVEKMESTKTNQTKNKRKRSKKRKKSKK